MVMNERIKELAEQAGFKVNWQHEDVQAIKMARFEKFAELIVKECMYVVNDAVDHHEPASTYVGKIREHFGVEDVDTQLRNRSTYFGNDY
jgi:hypothetical protein